MLPFDKHQNIHMLVCQPQMLPLLYCCCQWKRKLPCFKQQGEKTTGTSASNIPKRCVVPWANFLEKGTPPDKSEDKQLEDGFKFFALCHASSQLQASACPTHDPSTQPNQISACPCSIGWQKAQSKHKRNAEHKPTFKKVSYSMNQHVLCNICTMAT